METRADRARLALLIALQVATKDFTDQGAVAVLRWYEGFCASKGNNTNEPLDLSGMDIKILPDFVPLPLSFGANSLKLTNNPDLEDITAIQEMPLMTKLWTIEHAIDKETSLAMIRAMLDIRTALLESKIRLSLSLDDLDKIPVYLQLLSTTEYLELDWAFKITELERLSGMKKIKDLHLICFAELKNLRSLKKLPFIKNLTISRTSQPNIIDGIENLSSLKRVFLDDLYLTNIRQLENLPGLLELDIEDCACIQHLHGVDKLTKLKKLTVSRMRNMLSIGIEGKHTELEEMFLVGNKSLRDICGLKNLANFKKLSITLLKNKLHLHKIESALPNGEIEVWADKLSVLQGTFRELIVSKKYTIASCIELFTKKEINLLDTKQQQTPPPRSIFLHLLSSHMAAVSASSEFAPTINAPATPCTLNYNLSTVSNNCHSSS